MRLRAFLPAYLLLAVAVAYVLGALWTGLDRLDAIQRFSETSEHSERALMQLDLLQAAALDLEVGSRGFVLTGDEADLASFERGRTRAAELLTELRGTVRDQPVKLAQIEQLVPLLAELIAVTGSRIERRRAAGDSSAPVTLARRDREIFGAIRDIVTELQASERSAHARHRDTLLDAQKSARRDAFIEAGAMLALVTLLVVALQRIRSFVHPRPGAVRQDIDSDSPSDHHAALGTLLCDARMRVELAATAATEDRAARAHLESLRRTVERAIVEHAEVGHDLEPPAPSTDDVPEALRMLVSRYSTPNRLTVNAVVDSAAHAVTPEIAHLAYRAAEWALEVIAQRKRTGTVRLDYNHPGNAIELRVSALVDDAGRAIVLTPHERESAFVLRGAIATRGGSFDLAEGPTGVVVAVRLPDRVG